MKEIMGQYGQSIVAVLIALLLFLIIAGSSIDGKKGIYASVGQVDCLQAQESVSAENKEFERYWRLR